MYCLKYLFSLLLVPCILSASHGHDDTQVVNSAIQEAKSLGCMGGYDGTLDSRITIGSSCPNGGYEKRVLLVRSCDDGGCAGARIAPFASVVFPCEGAAAVVSGMNCNSL
jgi:hypothetical protein